MYGLRPSPHKELTRVPLGLKTSFHELQKMVHEILHGLDIVSYQDDWMISSDTFEEHTELLREVLRRLKEHNLRLSLRECQLFRTPTKFFGYNRGLVKQN